jgi:hypothetical protein
LEGERHGWIHDGPPASLHDRAIVQVVKADANGAIAPLVARTPKGEPFHTPIVIARER